MKLYTLILASMFVLMPMTVNAQEHKMTMSHEGGTASDKAFMDSHHKMMKDMDVKPTGNADADFVAMMIPHHQGAIDMAKVELEHGIISPLTDVTNDDLLTTGKVTLAHLNEITDYYTRLLKMEKEAKKQTQK